MGKRNIITKQKTEHTGRIEAGCQENVSDSEMYQPMEQMPQGKWWQPQNLKFLGWDFTKYSLEIRNIFIYGQELIDLFQLSE